MCRFLPPEDTFRPPELRRRLCRLHNGWPRNNFYDIIRGIPAKDISMPLIVLEGLDGAGKSTQLKMLKELLASRGRECESLHFPRFTSPVYGELIARFLRGGLGDIDSVDPYIVALLFAGDRADAAGMIREWLAEGKYVLLDRYVYSNVAYQCAKVAGEAEQEALRRWILQLEYEVNAIPRPDVSLFLDVPAEFTRRTLSGPRSGGDRDYLKGESDIHEASLDFQSRVREMYIRAASADDSFKIVECAGQDGSMSSPECIFEKIREQISGVLSSHASR